MARVLMVEPLLDVLDNHRVDFIVIGGFAVAAHGFVRATKDLDICPDPRRANLRRLAEALDELEATPLDLEEFAGEMDLKPDHEGLQRGGNWALSTKVGRLDILQTFQFEDADDDLGEYSTISGMAEERDFRGHQVKFCGYEDLLRMKRAAGRTVDQIDIESLKAARSEL
jgi:hypothetical protein